MMKKASVWILVFCMMFFAVGCGEKVTEDAKTGQEALGQTSGEGTQLQEDPQTGEISEEKMQEAVVAGIVFPWMFDEERLELDSVFDYSGINVDQEDVMTENAAAIQMKNMSGQYLKEAKISVTLADGKELAFLVKDVPAEMELIAFEITGQGYEGQQVEEVSAEAEYQETGTEEFAWSVEGSEITIRNLTDQTKENVVVYYHCSIEELGFGGRSYVIELGNLEAGESMTVTDSECYMGEIAVADVRSS